MFRRCVSIVSSLNQRKAVLFFRGGAASGSAKLMKDIIDEDSENENDDDDNNESVVDQIETVLNHGTHPHFHLHHYDHEQDQTRRLENNILKMLHAKRKSNQDEQDNDNDSVNVTERSDAFEDIKIKENGKLPYAVLKEEKGSTHKNSEKTKSSQHHRHLKLQIPPYVSCTKFLLVNRGCLFYMALTTGIRNRAKLTFKKEEDHLMKGPKRKRI